MCSEFGAQATKFNQPDRRANKGTTSQAQSNQLCNEFGGDRREVHFLSGPTPAPTALKL
jgi:hypothetical protein